MDYLTTQSFFQPGSLIAGRYEAVCTLGTGGMGSVLKVIDRALEGENIALKLLYPHLAQDATIFARFRNEVLIARRLAHPNIVRLYDFGHAGQGYYFVTMEWVSGGSLTKYIYDNRRERVPLADILRVLYEISLGMDHAHRQGVIHRDLKPDNILMTDRQEVKITDFGLARTMYVDRGFTDTGEAVGTPYYMSPEQLRGEKVDGRSDIYSFGIIAFEMVTGRRPFFDENYMELAKKHIYAPMPDIADKDSGIPVWFDKFAKRCAEKKPQDRYQSFAEIAGFLASQMEKLDKSTVTKRAPAVLSLYAPATPLRSRGSRGGFWVGLIMGALVVGGGLVSLRSPVIRGHLLAIGQRLGVNAESTVPITEAELFARVEAGDREAVETILSGGVAPKVTNHAKETPLHVALQKDQYGVASMLLAHGADPGARDAQKVTPLILVASKPASGENEEFAKELLAKKPVLQAIDDKGQTALMHAAESGNLPVIQLLVSDEHKAPVGVEFAGQDRENRTALILAAKAGQTVVIRYLLELMVSQHYEIGLNRADTSGRTALHYAAVLPESTITELLLKNGADPRLKDDAGKRPLDIATLVNRKVLANVTK